MNERIRELASQARKALAVDAMNGGEFNMQSYEEKFAALIVRECADICTARKLTPAEFVASELREYFGVSK